MEETQKENLRYGPEQLLLEDYIKMTKEKRIDFLKTLATPEQGRLIANLFVYNLNANVKYQDKLDKEEKLKTK